MDPANVSPVVAWLASADCTISGRVIEVRGWAHSAWRKAGATARSASSIGGGRPAEVGDAVRALVAESVDPEPVYGA